MSEDTNKTTFQQAAIDKAIMDGIRQGVVDRLKSSYGNDALAKAVNDSLERNRKHLENMIDDAISQMIKQDFRDQMIVEMRDIVAKRLVAKFGGEVEKQINELRANPATRAKIMTAITEIAAGKIPPA